MSQEQALGESALCSHTLVLEVSYEGTSYAGFAQQERQTHVQTIAGELRCALRTLLRRDVELTCAGRTDAGVHARAQFVSLPTSEQESETLSAQRLLRSLAAVLPNDIVVTHLWRARPGFSARFDALARTYKYRIFLGSVPPLFCKQWVWWIRGIQSLDIEAMELAAQALIGEHDFKSFCKSASAEGKPTSRYVESINFMPEAAFGEQMVTMSIVGNAFLHSMVRTIMGTLVEVGSGRQEPSWVSDVLAACDRQAAGPCAPAQGLTFWDVRYQEGLLQPW
ncbi:MAG: tRNA pseudouridine(38-40) synthase TruA [Coriobacteriales bacterium]|nr:tRNA pseudouridine(38-40) synthase TruA [Coriobacteriales bacterium]